MRRIGLTVVLALGVILAPVIADTRCPCGGSGSLLLAVQRLVPTSAGELARN